MIHVTHIRHAPFGFVYIGRRMPGIAPSPLGNPYKPSASRSVDECLMLYRRWLWSRIREGGAVLAELERIAAMAEAGDVWLACWCRKPGTDDFWGAFDIVRAYQSTETRIVVEVAHHAPTFRHLKAQGQNANTLSKIARNVGQVTREAQLLAEGLRRLGYQVIEKSPLGKKKGADGNYSAEADRREFEQLTGWTAHTNQHARDAARLALLA